MQNILDCDANNNPTRLIIHTPVDCFEYPWSAWSERVAQSLSSGGAWHKCFIGNAVVMVPKMMGAA